MTLVRTLVIIIAALTAALAAAAYRRSGASGEPFGAALREVAGEWSGPALRERARLAVIDGLRAAEMRAEAADSELADAALPR